jgi:hypothetical protein
MRSEKHAPGGRPFDMMQIKSCFDHRPAWFRTRGHGARFGRGRCGMADGLRALIGFEVFLVFGVVLAVGWLELRNIERIRNRGCKPSDDAP